LEGVVVGKRRAGQVVERGEIGERGEGRGERGSEGG
jgi:hypothetical protein